MKQNSKIEEYNEKLKANREEVEDLKKNIETLNRAEADELIRFKKLKKPSPVYSVFLTGFTAVLSCMAWQALVVTGPIFLLGIAYYTIATKVFEDKNYGFKKSFESINNNRKKMYDRIDELQKENKEIVKNIDKLNGIEPKEEVLQEEEQEEKTVIEEIMEEKSLE